jgi:hypothetical protein
MTRKGFLTIAKRWPLARLLSNPCRTFALYSHRYVRYASPVFLLAALLGAAVILVERLGALPTLAAIGGLSTLALAPGPTPVVGRIGQTARSFLVANWGFALGLAGVIRGDRSGRYRPTHAAAADPSG